MSRHDRHDTNAHKTNRGQVRWSTLAQTGDDPLPDDLRHALGDVNEQDREKYPRLFKKVDATKRGPRGQQGVIQPSTRKVSECPWCGDPFPVTSRTQQFCTPECGREMQRFLRERKAERMTDEAANAIPPPTPRKPPLAESLELADLIDEQGNIR